MFILGSTMSLILWANSDEQKIVQASNLWAGPRVSDEGSSVGGSVL
jgi:hypothetical protein